MKNTMHPGGQDHLGAEIFFRYSLLASLIAGVIIGQTQRIVNAFWCLLLSYRFLLRQVPPLCGDCGNGLRFPPGQARSQRARLTGFCGAAAPQHRRGAPVKGGFGVATPTSSGPGEQMSGAKFGPRVDTCSPLQEAPINLKLPFSFNNPSANQNDGKDNSEKQERKPDRT